ncbi:hypothetical protein ACJ2A9_03850 [Anaerobacillus sp. MEB173]|uniref:hypothetical protein n=1 Tax=Anaerobacillus sp. MEB173 TaxID=3383345 RepID=UPI003F909175
MSRDSYLSFRSMECSNWKKQKWWVFHNKPNSYLLGEFPFNIGPFLVGSMWILKWTYGNFIKFISLNAIVDGLFVFIFIKIMNKLKVAQLVRVNHFPLMLFYW